MVKGQEKSDGRMVPEGRRKPTPTAKRRGGKATTASERKETFKLTPDIADNPTGNAVEANADRSVLAKRAEPKPGNIKNSFPPAMTMEEISDHRNLKTAFEHVAKNKGAPGPDAKSIADVRKHLDKTLDELHRTLRNGSYRPGNIRRVWIPKSSGGKRGLGIPDVVDRIVQQAVLQVLSPHYEPTFHASSHGFRPGRSCHTAINEAKQYLDQGYTWVVDFDLSKFFDRVHHQRLLARLEKRVKDRRIIQLIHQLLKAKVVLPDGVVVNTHEGTPQGGPLSPLLSNIVLDELDWELHKRRHHFVRYADDCNVYVRSQRAGERVMNSITRFIEHKLRLKVNLEKSAVARPQSRHFLGFRLRKRSPKDDTEVLLSKRSKQRIYERIRELTPRTWGHSLKECIRQINVYLQGWMGFFCICSKAALSRFKAIDARLRRRLRAIILRQWKRRRTMAKKLIKLGVKPKTAWRTIYDHSRSWWNLSCRPAVHRALKNAFFAKQGLQSLCTTWVNPL